MKGFADFAIFVRTAFFPSIFPVSSARHLHDFNGHSIVARVIDNRVYVPVFLDGPTKEIIMNNGYPANADIVYDISGFRTVNHSVSHRILRTFFGYSNVSDFLHINTSKGYGYNGTKGIILDDDYMPLMIFCISYDIIGQSLKEKGPIVFISPRVFNNTDIVSKYIVKSVIPNITSVNTRGSYPSIIISDMIDGFVNNPRTPDIDFNDDIYMTLENHKRYCR